LKEKNLRSRGHIHIDKKNSVLFFKSLMYVAKSGPGIHVYYS